MPIIDYQKYLLPFAGSKFIKEIYFGSSQLLGFNKSIQLVKNKDDRVEVSDCSIKNSVDFVIGAGGYTNVNAPCSQLTLGIGYYNPETVNKGIYINFIDMLTNKTIFQYQIYISSYSSIGNLTYRSYLKNESGTILKSTDWSTSATFSRSFDLFKYDFDNGKWVFTFSEGSDNGSNSTYTTSRAFVPVKIKIGSSSGFQIRLPQATIQN